MHTEQNNAVQSYIDALLFEQSAIKGISAGDNDIQSVTQPVSLDTGGDTRLHDGVSLTAPSKAIKSRAFVRHLELAQQNSVSDRAANDKGPNWVGDNVACLLVKTANLKLAIPRQFIEAVEPIAETGAMNEGHSTRHSTTTVSYTHLTLPTK